MLELWIIALGVAADATAVAIASSVRGITRGMALAMACSFGAAQALMAAIGWLGGSAFGDLWNAWDHWIALILLSFVGLRMIKEAWDEERESLVGGLRSLALLTLATSIDALAVGVSLPTLHVMPLSALLLIGVVTFVLTLLGATAGRYLGERFGQVMEVLGGLALIAIGIRIVIEHTA